MNSWFTLSRAYRELLVSLCVVVLSGTPHLSVPECARVCGDKLRMSVDTSKGVILQGQGYRHVLLNIIIIPNIQQGAQ
jgi:hypothetical protein